LTLSRISAPSAAARSPYRIRASFNLSLHWSAKCPDSPSSLPDADNTTSLLVMSGAKLRTR